MIQNVVFDIGNVLVTFKPKEYYQEILKEQCSHICDLVFASSYWKDYDDGLLTLQEVKSALLRCYPSSEKEITLVTDQWFELMKPIEAMMELRKTCRQKGYGIYIISNLSEDSYQYLQIKYQLFDDLDGRVLSFEEKFGKPDVRMYDYLCTRYHLDPSTCLFIDDRLVNIEAAKAMGMQCIHMQTIEQTMKEAREILC